MEIMTPMEQSNRYPIKYRWPLRSARVFWMAVTVAIAGQLWFEAASAILYARHSNYRWLRTISYMHHVVIPFLWPTWLLSAKVGLIAFVLSCIAIIAAAGAAIPLPFRDNSPLIATLRQAIFYLLLAICLGLSFLSLADANNQLGPWLYRLVTR